MQRFHPLDGLISDPSISLLELMVPLVDYNFKLPLILFIKYKEIQAISKSLLDLTFLKDNGFIFDKDADIWDIISKQMPSDMTRQLNQAKQMMTLFNSMENSSEKNQDECENECENESLYNSIMDILNDYSK